MDEKQNQTNPQVDVNPVAVVGAVERATSQPPVVNQQAEQKATPSGKRKRAALIVTGVVLGIPALFFVYLVIWVGSMFYSMDKKMDRLQKVADTKAAILTDARLIDGQTNEAEAVVNGDGLTASEDPKRSTHAEITLNTNGALSSLETQVSRNLAKKGFQREGSSTAPYYSFNSSYDGASSSIAFRYVKGDDVVRVSYSFDKGYECPEGKICAYTSKTKDPSEVYDMRAYAELKVHKINAVYADREYYMTQING